MPRPAVVLVLLVVAACGGSRTAVVHRAAPGDVAIVGATVVPMDREGALAGHTVLVRGDRIVAVAPAEQIDTSGAVVVDARGRWVMPGLADMHVHTWGKRDLALFLLNGVTSVRDLFGSAEQLRWKEAIAKGELDGPTIYASGPIFDGDPPTWPGSAVVTTPDAARAEVRAQQAAGHDWIKVYGGLSADVYAAILDEAAKVGMPVAGHVPRAVGIDGVLAAGGLRTIEHLDGYVPFSDPLPEGPLVAATVKAGVWNCPTLVVTDRFGFMDDPDSLAGTRGLELVEPAMLAQWNPRDDFRLQKWTPEMFAQARERNQRRRALVGELHEAGARLVLGTDTGNPYVVPGFAVIDELELLVASGLTPWQALRTATAAAGELQGERFGVLAVGARADLIIVGRDPLAAVGNLADPEVVIVRGEVFRRDALVAAAALPVAGADPFAGLAPLASEGTPVVTARYEVLLRDTVLGHERAAVGRLAGGGTVVHGQIRYRSPRELTASYRVTADALDLVTDALSPPEVVVRRAGGKVTARHGDRAPVEVEAGAEAVLAPQSIGEFFRYGELLADLAVGATRELTAAEIVTEGSLAVEPGRYTFTREPDQGGQRVYTFAGSHGRLAVTGRLVVDTDGAPAEVTVSVMFGTFVTRRLP